MGSALDVWKWEAAGVCPQKRWGLSPRKEIGTVIRFMSISSNRY